MNKRDRNILLWGFLVVVSALSFLVIRQAHAGPVSPCFWSGTTAKCLPADGVLAPKMKLYESAATTGDIMSMVAPALAADITVTFPAATGTLATLAGTEVLTNKTLSGNTSSNFVNTGTITLPTTTTTLAGLAVTETFTAKQTLDNAATDIGTSSSGSRTLTVLTGNAAGNSPRIEVTRNGTLNGRFAAEGTAGTLITASAVGDLIISSGAGQSMWFTVTPGTTNQGSINGSTGAWTIGQASAGTKHTLNTATGSTGVGTLTVTNAPTTRTTAGVFISITINGTDYIIPAFLP